MSLSDTVSLAVDLGTTTIAASLLDASGRRLADGGSLNPQREFGADVVTRLGAAVASQDIRHRMARSVNAELERLAHELLADAELPASCLSRVAIAGNPAMEHFLLDLPVDSLSRIPYRPLFTDAKSVPTSDLGWGLGADAYIFPLPGGFVGGDLIAFLYGLDCFRSPIPDLAPRLFLDLGTNAEIALSAGDRIFATSAAAGPAFEGGNLSAGMPAFPGAISGVVCDRDRFRVETIAGDTPQGICGSGAMSAIAALIKAGVIEPTGRLRPPEEVPSNLANRLSERNGELSFVLYRDAQREIALTQEDVRQLQVAKAAIRAGIEVILARAGMAHADIGELVITGSFGSVLGPELLQALGIVPPVDSRTRFVTNGALAGIERFLNDPDGADGVSGLVSRLTVVPLSGNPRFEEHFVHFMDF